MLAGDSKVPARVQTDGINFEDVVVHTDLVDANGITTNDVAAMLRTYGVEVGRAWGGGQLSSILYRLFSV